jgi:hypothetical protein
MSWKKDARSKDPGVEAGGHVALKFEPCSHAAGDPPLGFFASRMNESTILQGFS